jgi:hypothetical protein
LIVQAQLLELRFFFACFSLPVFPCPFFLAWSEAGGAWWCLRQSRRLHGKAGAGWRNGWL